MSTLAPVRPRAVLAVRWHWCRLPELASGDLYAVMVARQQVFAVEQRCAFLDADGLDAHAFHLLGWDEQDAVPVLACYLRLFYASLGFRIDSAPFQEDGIPHVEMLYPGHAMQ